jgi:hypothetical protein
MVCDFYVYTYLEIKHKNGICYIELEKKNDWYCDCLEPDMDSDDEEEKYKKRCKEYLDNFLKPSYDPILIYDGFFLKQLYIDKYLHIIKQKAEGLLKYWRDSGDITNVNQIEQIRKIEIRETT